MVNNNNTLEFLAKQTGYTIKELYNMYTLTITRKHKSNNDWILKLIFYCPQIWIKRGIKLTTREYKFKLTVWNLKKNHKSYLYTRCTKISVVQLYLKHKAWLFFPCEHTNTDNNNIQQQRLQQSRPLNDVNSESL